MKKKKKRLDYCLEMFHSVGQQDITSNTKEHQKMSIACAD